MFCGGESVKATVCRGRQQLAALLQHQRVRQVQVTAGDSAAHICTQAKSVVPRFQQPGVFAPGSAAVVKAGKVPIRGGESQALVLAGGQFLGFGKGDEHLGGLAQCTAGTAGVQLYHLLTGQCAGVLYLHLHGDRLVLDLCFFHLTGKVRVRQTITKGVQHPLRRKGLKVPIAHKNIFCIAVLCLVAKVLCRVVGVGFGDGVRQVAAWVHLPGEHIRHRVTALHAQLPGQQNGADLVAVGVDFRKVHNAADIQHQHHFLKGGGYCVQQGLFFIRQVKAAFF